MDEKATHVIFFAGKTHLKDNDYWKRTYKYIIESDNDSKFSIVLTYEDTDKFGRKMELLDKTRAANFIKDISTSNIHWENYGEAQYFKDVIDFAREKFDKSRAEYEFALKNYNDYLSRNKND